jgi:hypothetical protein
MERFPARGSAEEHPVETDKGRYAKADVHWMLHFEMHQPLALDCHDIRQGHVTSGRSSVSLWAVEAPSYISVGLILDKSDCQFSVLRAWSLSSTHRKFQMVGGFRDTALLLG